MKFLQRGNEVDFIETQELAVTDELPVGTYILKCEEFRGFYLERVADFKVTERIYGEAPELADMIYNGFTDRSVSTGALLYGYKGTGKTSLVRLIAERASSDGKPVILINEPFSGTAFNSVIDKLPDSVVIYDEFEKVYKRGEQEKLLTVFDGTTTTKCLFLLTANNYHAIDEHLINRPGRLLYSIEFSGLSDQVIDEYLDVNLRHPHLADGIRKVFSVFSGTTFDMMKGIVDEVNRTGKPAIDLLPYLNIDLTSDQYTTYNARIEKGNRIFNNDVVVRTNPLGMKAVNVWFEGEKEDSDGDPKWEDFNLTPEDFVSVKGDDIQFKKNGYVITFMPQKNKPFVFDAV